MSLEGQFHETLMLAGLQCCLSITQISQARTLPDGVDSLGSGHTEAGLVGEVQQALGIVQVELCQTEGDPYMIERVLTVTPDLCRAVHILLQIVARRRGIHIGCAIDAAHIGLQRLSVGIRPHIAVLGHSSLQTYIALLISFHQVLGRAVSTLTASTCARHADGEVILLERIGSAQHAAGEDNLLQSLGVLPVGLSLEQASIVRRQRELAGFGRVDQVEVSLSGCLPKRLVIIRIEQRTGMIEGGTSTECQHGQVIGATGFRDAQGHLA